MASRGLDDEIARVDETIMLRTADGRSFEVPKSMTKQSELMQTILDGDKLCTSIDIGGDITGDTMHRVLVYMRYHHGNPAADIQMPLRSVVMREVVCAFDADFVDGISKPALFDLVKAANYLHITPLLHLACAKVASLIKDKSVDEISAILDPSNP
jgi:S-phase kinase-associated protein 1